MKDKPLISVHESSKRFKVTREFLWVPVLDTGQRNIAQFTRIAFENY